MLGNVAFFASLRRISSTKSNEDRSGWLAAAPPERQLSPLQLQTTSFGSGLSWQAMMCGAMTTASSSAPARKAAAVAVAK